LSVRIAEKPQSAWDILQNEGHGSATPKGLRRFAGFFLVVDEKERILLGRETHALSWECVGMSSPGQNLLPQLAVGDFGPGLDHVVEIYANGKVFALLHQSDPARQILPHLQFALHDLHS
jgi:hypothetical protein